MMPSASQGLLGLYTHSASKMMELQCSLSLEKLCDMTHVHGSDIKSDLYNMNISYFKHEIPKVNLQIA